MKNTRMAFVALWLVSTAPVSAQVPAPSPDADDAIVVHGYPPHCHPRSSDPQDAVDLTAAAGHPRQQVIRIDPATGKFGLFPDDYPETDLRAWQRDGTRLDQYIFRVPADDAPVCIGSRTRSAPGFAQLRRAFAARPYWGKVMRSRPSSRPGRSPTSASGWQGVPAVIRPGGK